MVHWAGVSLPVSLTSYSVVSTADSRHAVPISHCICYSAHPQRTSLKEPQRIWLFILSTVFGEALVCMQRLNLFCFESAQRATMLR